ncbi:MAG: ATP-grasp domain-containing protein [Actinomycetota bacterium]|nr:ATP-grasp domain-containing protein [Actinomycetota bacterium]
MAREPHARALVLGDRDLVAPLHRAGVAVTVVSPPAASVRFSRYASGWLLDPRPDEDALCIALLEEGRKILGPAALFYEEDADALFISRRRADLATELRFVIPSADLVERLIDKAAFQQFATDLGLPVPAGRQLDLCAGPPDLSGISFPVVVKPLWRERAWEDISPAKALLVDGPERLRELLAGLAPAHESVLVQSSIRGPETAIESYHVYVDAEGEVAAQFTGRKLRTYPQHMGHSTALVSTDSADVAALGRAVVQAIQLRGVAKLDFKRDAEGRLWLLEINPRFNLWHHLGAAAGVNIPAVVWADLVGEARPPSKPARPGVSWCHVKRDWRAAREQRIGLARWLRWVATCDTRVGLNPADPLPLVATKVVIPAAQRLSRLTGRGR